MKTLQQIAELIKTSARKEMHRENGIITSIYFDNGCSIHSKDKSSVIFIDKLEGDTVIDVIDLRTHSNWFNDICKCNDCKDTGEYSLRKGDEYYFFPCSCDNLPFRISVDSKVKKKE